MEATSLDFSRLEKISLTERRLRETLDNFIPAGERRLQLQLAIEQALQQSLRGGCTLHGKAYRLEAAEEWRDHAAGDALYVTLSVIPTGAKMVLVWDPVLALALVDRVLGGELKEVPVARQLTEIEIGVISFLLMQACRVFDQMVAESANGEFAPIRIEKVFHARETLLAAMAGAKQVAVMDVSVAIPELTGLMQMVLPDNFIEEVMQPRVKLPEQTLGVAEERARLESLGDLTFPMRAVVGESALLPAELGALEPGDIVLLDQAHARMEQGRLQGHVQLKALRPGAPTLMTQIRDDGPPAQLEIIEMYREA